MNYSDGSIKEIILKFIQIRSSSGIMIGLFKRSIFFSPADVSGGPTKSRTRLAVALVYFGMGLCFSTWASRIPDIKTTLRLSDAVFGSILFAIPVGQFLMMPFSGRLVTFFGSRKVMLFAVPLYSLILCNIGLVTAGWQLAVVLFLFGLSGNLCNISINTQAITVEKWYGRQIMASFHGSWSLAGFTGALTGLLMMNFKMPPLYHFIFITSVVWINLAVNRPYLLAGRADTSSGSTRRKFFSKPDSMLFQLGVIAFFSMASEGCMFDWSGIYFKDVVNAPASLVVLGYTSFMVMMAIGRFVADSIIADLGRGRWLRISGILISSGLFTAVIFPYLIPSTIAFMVVGIGVSSVIPTVYSAAGRHPTIPPGLALATVASVGFLGFLMGPPLIGYISEAFSLRYSFAVIGIFGVGITLLVSRIRALNQTP